MSYLELLQLAAPETVVVLAALAVLTVDLTSLRGLETRFRFIIGGMIASAGCAAAMVWLAALQPHGQVAGGMFVADPLTALVKVAILGLTIFTVLLSFDSGFTAHVGEYLALVLLAAVGMMFLVSAEDLMMIFVSLEFVSLSLYILTAFNKRNPKSAEAALKYFLFGGMAAAFTLFGLSLLYGLTGSTNLREIATALAGKGLDPLLIVAIVTTVTGFGFKVAAVPFHLWAPDAYEGAPTSSAAFIASGSKVASFFIFAKVMMLGFAGAEGSGAWRGFASGWVPLIAAMTAVSMVLGNLAALVQCNLKRLIAYSAVAHAGYALLGALSDNAQGLTALLYYAVTYGLTALGAFGVVAVVEREGRDSQLQNFTGLMRRAPVVSACMMVFMLSLAGIPPLAGFFGKFYVFIVAVAAAKNLGLLWLVILAIAMSAVSLYYYLQVLKQICVVEPPDDLPPMKTPVLTRTVLVVLAAGVLLLGALPSLLLGPISLALKGAGF